jgi:threonine-phosphate decarboxylase
MAAAVAALDDIEYFNEQNSDTKKLRSELEEDLKKIKGLRVFHSSGNFILMDSGGLGVKGEEVVKYCLEKNIQIRLTNNPELGEGYFRITIGRKEQNKRFVQTLKEFLSK